MSELRSRRHHRNRLKKLFYAIMYAVTRQARWQREVEPGMDAFFNKSVGRIESRFCLAHAHRCLQHIDTLFSYGIYKRLLSGIWIETKDIAE